MNGEIVTHIASVVSRQHGEITRTQLLQLGLQPGAVKRRVASAVFAACTAASTSSRRRGRA